METAAPRQGDDQGGREEGVKKIPSLFVRPATVGRKPENVINEVVQDAAWVVAGEGMATRKWDGTCCMVRDRRLYKRYDCKGKEAPPNFEEATGPGNFVLEHHKTGWIPVGDEPDSKYHREAFMGLNAQHPDEPIPDGTYELCGPKINGNPERLDKHVLIPHGKYELSDCPVTYDGLKEWFVGKDIEGVVWHHPDGRMAKCKKRDFGMARNK